MAGESTAGPSWGPTGLVPGSSVAGYRLESSIGTGGSAVVFRARDEQLDRTVALKVLTPELGEDAEFRERFIRESRAAAAVDHPHIIPVYAAGEADGMLYIAMRFVAGGDLHSVLDREGPLSANRTASFISPVASALDAAHAARLVHRDVKPANILVDTSPGRPDHPYLSDFGITKDALSSVTLTGTGQFVGTPDYCAPEQIAGKQVNVQTDQYALACVTYTLLTGQMPFVRDQSMAVLWAHMSDPPPSVTRLRPDLPAAVDQVIARAMAKSPEDRFGSCGQFADSLRSALRLRSYSAPPTSSAPAAVLAPPTEEVKTNPGATARFTPHYQATEVFAPAAPAGPSAPDQGWAGGPQRPRRPRGRLVAVAAAVAVLAAIGVVAAILLAKPSGGKPSGASGTTGATGTSRATGTTAAPPAAAHWQAPTAIDAGADLTGVSCPRDVFCMATDSGGSVLSYNQATWSAPVGIASGANLAGVSCASPGFCAAVVSGSTTAYIYSGGTWTSSQLVGADGGPAHLTAVSCPAAGFCVATGGLNVYQYTGGAWSHGTQLKHGGAFTSVSCASTTFCLAVDNGGSAYSFTRGSWSAPVSVATGTDLQGVSCASADFCAAIGTGATAYIDQGGTWTSAQLVGASGKPANLTAVSCPAVGHCVATGAHDAYQYKAGAWSRGTHLVDGTKQFTSISCPRDRFCAAVDNGGNAYMYR